MVSGIVRGARVQIVGAAVLRVRMTELNKETSPVVYFRCKIFEAGASDWHGLILGGRALDCVEEGGLGFMPTAGAHAFKALGILMARRENRAGQTEVDEAYRTQVWISDEMMVNPGLSCVDQQKDPIEGAPPVYRVQESRAESSPAL